jgi:pyridoxal phosphate enzyme (YggS family)
MLVRQKVALIEDRIAAAARRTGRNPGDITLMAVSKTFPPELIREAYSAGLRHFGENRVQEFSAKRDALRDLHGAEWHMIGHLQTNKAARAAELFMAIDSVDSLRLAQKLDDAGRRLGKKLGALIEINAGGEVAKSGLDFTSPELETLLRAAPSLQHLEFRGLMTVPPFFEDPQQARPWFRKLRELRDRIAAQRLPQVNMNVLSMGMSHDFEVAIEEGSTCVRLGTAIFGDRASFEENQPGGISGDQSG